MTARRLVTFTYVLAPYGGLIAASQPAVAGALRAGVAKIDVTPPADKCSDGLQAQFADMRARRLGLFRGFGASRNTDSM
jgi:hypothetical protein